MSSVFDKIVGAVTEKVEKGEDVFLNKRSRPGYVSSQSFEVDALIGRPGIPLGRISEITGESGSGKSMLCCQLIAETQKQGGTAVLIDTERSYTGEWAESLGVDTSKVLDVVGQLNIISLESALRAIHIVLDAVDESDTDPVVIIVDSLSALPTESELEADYDDLQPAVHAKLLSKGMRKLTDGLFAKKVALVFVSQLRDKVMTFGFGNPTTSLGGKAIFYHCALAIELKRVASIKDGGKSIGMDVRVKIKKNKLGGTPFDEGIVKFYYAHGFDNVMSALALAEKLNIVTSNRGWYQIAGQEKKFRESEWVDIVSDELLDRIRGEAFPSSEGV